MRILRWFVRGILGIAAIAAIAIAAVYWMASRSLPDHDGTTIVRGIGAKIEILRDSFGVPRIFAQSREDAIFALGYMHATDRLWQMDTARRLAQGRLAERFGEAALPTDRLMRALDLDGHAARSVGALTNDSRAMLEVYSTGVNARLAEIEEGGQGRGAPEFYLFGGAIEPWLPEDSLAVIKTMAFQISMASLQNETARGRMLLSLSPDQVRDLYPDYRGRGVDELRPQKPDRSGAPGALKRTQSPLLPASPQRADVQATPPDQALAFLGLDVPQMAGASNVWAVDGSRTAGRASLLASDPHLPLTAPSIWYPAQMSAPGFAVIGAGLPGVPAIVYGRSDKIAWGLTATQLDDMDVFIERTDPANPAKYAGPGGALNFETRTEIVDVRGGDPVKLELRRTRHGPVVPLTTAGLAAVTPKDHVAALAWTALADDDATLDAIMVLNRAETAEDALKAARFVVAPALNLVVADKDTIGMAVTGRAPLRRITTPIQGRVPSPGWTDRHDWTGWLAERDLPRLIEPKSGALANANNKVGNRPFPRNLSHDFDAPYRIDRIEKLLNAREAHSIESFKAMQADNGSEMARALLPLMGRALWDGSPPEGAHPLRAKVLPLLKVWNGEMSEHAPEPLIFMAWIDALKRRVVADELGGLLPVYSGPHPQFLGRVLRDVSGAARWCDDIASEVRESCETVAAAALDEALEALEARYGADVARWRWGIAHRALHRNQTLTEVATTLFGTRIGLSPFVNIEQETSGGDYTLNRGAMRHAGAQPFRNEHGAGFRGIYDFSDLDRSVYIVSTGVSGHPMSQFYANLSALWRIGEYMPMSLDRRDIEPGAVGRMLLKSSP